MALTDIITKIKNDAEAESARLRNEAEEEARKILKEAAKKADDILEAGKESAFLLNKETHDRTMSSGTYQAKFASQGFQASLINRTFETVEKKLSELSDSAYQKFVETQVKALPEKEGILTVSRERKEETLNALKTAGVETKDAKEAPLLGGFILETKTAEYDHSLKELVRQARESYSGEAANVLFPN